MLVRAPNGNATERRRDGGSHHGGIEVDCAQEHRREHKRIARDRNLRGQDQFAAALNLHGKLFDALLKARDLVA